MAATYTNGIITSEVGNQNYDFLIVKAERNIGLPQHDIDALRLKPSVFAFASGAGGSNNGNGNTVYMAWANFSGSAIDLDVLPSEVPTVGVAVLRTLGFSVDLEDGTVVKPATTVEIHRGLSPWSRPVGHDRLYATSDDGWVYALDVANLEVAWHSKLLEGRTITRLVVANGKVYVALADGWVYALDAANLEMEWRNSLLEGGIITHFVVADGKVYVALADGWVYALDAANLEMEWRNSLLEGETITHLSVASGRLYAVLEDGGMYALNGGNLELLMRATLPDGKAIANFATLHD
ncbi:MAG: PQQ-binding-like beta-propeller repeat protein [Dehalococcoidia bacterium]|nr:PQQ-binding-like beta-propeller repeat protein [Dehalococcoidia bacterium]